MYDLYEIQVESPTGAYLHVVTTAVTPWEARNNVLKMLASFASAPRAYVADAVNDAAIRKVELQPKG